MFEFIKKIFKSDNKINEQCDHSFDVDDECLIENTNINEKVDRNVLTLYKNHKEVVGDYLEEYPMEIQKDMHISSLNLIYLDKITNKKKTLYTKTNLNQYKILDQSCEYNYHIFLKNIKVPLDEITGTLQLIIVKNNRQHFYKFNYTKNEKYKYKYSYVGMMLNEDKLIIGIEIEIDKDKEKDKGKRYINELLLYLKKYN